MSPNNSDIEEQSSSPVAVAKELPPINVHQPVVKQRSFTFWMCLVSGLLVLTLGLGVGLVVVVLRGNDGAPSPAPSPEPAVAGNALETSGPEPSPAPSFSPGPPIPDGPPPFLSVGCFQVETSLDNHKLLGSSWESWAWQCSARCFTRYFGVSSNRECHCFVGVPDGRLAIGSCESADTDIPMTERMELYFKEQPSTTCSQPRTETVRNFLVEEDDAPFGFDIVSNTFRSSPFELFKDECGTNIYEVQTEVSEGSTSLQTTMEEVRSFAVEQRRERASSLSVSASVSFGRRLFGASARVSASRDTEQTNLFKSSGSSEIQSKVFTSLGVKRLAEVKIVDFENTYRFVTLSRQFGNILRDYLTGGFAKEKAYDIITKYGQFVLTRGIFGGYMQLRSTILGTDLFGSFESEDAARECYEASVSAEARAFGFRGKSSSSSSGCTEEMLALMQARRDQYMNEVREQSVVGGRKSCATCEEFVVEAQDSTLLTTLDKYPPTDSDGVQFRLLSDFLAPNKISPLMVKQLQITEEQFGQIHDNLQEHIIEYLTEIGDIIGECNCTAGGLPYLDEDDEGNQVCSCYDPEAVSGGVLPLNPATTYSKRGNRRTCAWDRCPSSGFQWYRQLGDGCDCNDGLNSCYLEGDAIDIERFDEASLIPVDNDVENGIYKMEAEGASLALGHGLDCASGNDCFSDPLRGGFQIDLSETDYVFEGSTKVTVEGWSPRMLVTVDGVALPKAGLWARGGNVDIMVPDGTKLLHVNCGGWCGSCSSELYVKKMP